MMKQGDMMMKDGKMMMDKGKKMSESMMKWSDTSAQLPYRKSAILLNMNKPFTSPGPCLEM
jgi:hypothetical protein